MGLIIHSHYHGVAQLKKQNIPFEQDHGQPAIQVGIINLMPKAHLYEIELLFALAQVSLPIRPIWIRMNSHAYNSCDPQALSQYRSFDQVESPLDLLILTGAPIETKAFSEIHYWPELREVLLYAQCHITNTLGICWGGLALGYLLGLEKRTFSHKLFGVFEQQSLEEKHPLFSGLGDKFSVPVSTHAGFSDQTLETAQRQGTVRCLSHHPETGYLIAENDQFLMHFGHPEYRENRLPEEYQRDCTKGRVDTLAPKNIDLNNPKDFWRTQSNSFFENWVQKAAHCLPNQQTMAS